MKKSFVSNIIFYDDSGNVILQDRKKIKSHGEDYGFFGGHRKDGETREETLKRELKEELGLSIEDLEDYRFFKHFDELMEKIPLDVEREIFLAKIPKNFKDLKVTEGFLAHMSFEKGFNVKMLPGDTEILKEVYLEISK